MYFEILIRRLDCLANCENYDAIITSPDLIPPDRTCTEYSHARGTLQPACTSSPSFPLRSEFRKEAPTWKKRRDTIVEERRGYTTEPRRRALRATTASNMFRGEQCDARRKIKVFAGPHSAIRANAAIANGTVLHESALTALLIVNGCGPAVAVCKSPDDDERSGERTVCARERSRRGASSFSPYQHPPYMCVT